jgi:demethylmenaquinone methyltransferase/2-methoxy-6-polyprenyl-1,4-benzoquinol methylase
MNLKNLLRAPTKEEERAFERENVLRKREHYLATNPLERFSGDPAYRAKVERIEAALGEPGGRVLDVGGNTAGEATILQQHGYRMVVGDINEAALDISRERVGKFGLKQPEFVAFDAHHLPFRDGTFQAVTIIEALHHMVDYGQVLAEVHRVLAPGGIFYSMEPNALNPIRRAAEVRDRFRGTIEKSFYPGQLRRLVEAAGFERVEVEAFGIEKPEWKRQEVPGYRRWLFRLHCWLGLRYPGWFGSLAVTARKAGSRAAADPSSGSIHDSLKSPCGARALVFDPALGCWKESGGGESFADLNGIPVLVAKDG